MHSLTNRVEKPAHQWWLKKNDIVKAVIKPNDETVDDLPSELSDDEWGEINRYGQILYED